MKKFILWIVILLVIVSVFYGSFMSSHVEQAKYKVIEAHDSIEVREYDPMVVAKTEVFGDRKRAIKEGFKLIADYIFGNNASNQKVAMTAPVMQQAVDERWQVMFMMPSEHTLKTLPEPQNKSVELREIKSKRFAVIRFSGFAGKGKLHEETKKLESFIESHNLLAVSSPIYAFFNPPWTLPFLRRNEIMIEIK